MCVVYHPQTQRNVISSVGGKIGLEALYKQIRLMPLRTSIMASTVNQTNTRWRKMYRKEQKKEKGKRKLIKQVDQVPASSGGQQQQQQSLAGDNKHKVRRFLNYLPFSPLFCQTPMKLCSRAASR